MKKIIEEIRLEIYTNSNLTFNEAIELIKDNQLMDEVDCMMQYKDQTIDNLDETLIDILQGLIENY